MELRELTIADYDEVIALLGSVSGVTLRDADSREATGKYLARNPGLSFVAIVDGQIVGCVMCGHDGRRGYLQHLAVAEAYRRRGIGASLVERCLGELKKLGILKTHIDVLVGNSEAIEFWKRRGWQLREDICRLSFSHGNNPRA